MLYISTRNQKDTYTAYRALNEVTAPDGGVLVPFHLTAFTQDELDSVLGQTPCETIAQVLNLFFGVYLSGLDVEFAIGKMPFKLETMQHKFTVVECWKNPAYTYDYILKSLNGLMAERKIGNLPAGWSCIGIKIALLFGLYTQMGEALQGMDIAVTAGDYSDLTAIAYAKKMGLPVEMTVCACDNDSAFWDLVNRGAYSANASNPDYMEAYLYALFDTSTPTLQIDTDSTEDTQKTALSAYVYAAVVSNNRVDSVISNMYRTNGYSFDAEAALAYSGLQDYRSSTGVSKDTLIFSKNRPARIKE